MPSIRINSIAKVKLLVHHLRRINKKEERALFRAFRVLGLDLCKLNSLVHGTVSDHDGLQVLVRLPRR